MMKKPEQSPPHRISTGKNAVAATGSRSVNDPSFVNYKYEDQSAGHLMATHQSGPDQFRDNEFRPQGSSPELGHKSFQNI